MKYKYKRNLIILVNIMPKIYVNIIKIVLTQYDVFLIN